MKTKPNAFIVWQGTSLLNDQTEIVMIVTGLVNKSRNSKTGPMAQVFYLHADLHPVEAIELKEVDSICGDCPLIRDVCYVVEGQAPAAVYRGFKRGIYPQLDYSNSAHVELLRNFGIRLGAYGDPASVPDYVNLELLQYGNGKHTGYTHQWKTLANDRIETLASYCMLSCDDFAELAIVNAMGYRGYLYIPEGQEPPERNEAIECLYSTKGIQCNDCNLCDGGNTRPSVWIGAHGIGAVNL